MKPDLADLESFEDRLAWLKFRDHVVRGHGLVMDAACSQNRTVDDVKDILDLHKEPESPVKAGMAVCLMALLASFQRARSLGCTLRQMPAVSTLNPINL